MKSLYVTPVVVGVLVDILGTLLFSALVGFIVFFAVPGNLGTGFLEQTLEKSVIKIPMLIVGFLFTMLGAYIAGRMAKAHKRLHGLLVGCMDGLLALIFSVFIPLASDDFIFLNSLIDIGGILLTILTAYWGGLVAASVKDEAELPGTSAKPLTKILFIGTAVLIIGYSGVHAAFYERIPNCVVETLYIQGEVFSTAPTITDPENADSAIMPETYSIGFQSIIEEINKNTDIKAILVDINSQGGDPVAGEEIANVLKNSEKPVIALIRSQGLSAAYWAATGADIIFASNNSQIGGIDQGALTASFVQAVADNRQLSIVDVQKIADGSVVLGSEAVKSGLIDRIGDYNLVKNYIKETYGEKATVCETYYEE